AGNPGHPADPADDRPLRRLLDRPQRRSAHTVAAYRLGATAFGDRARELARPAGQLRRPLREVVDEHVVDAALEDRPQPGDADRDADLAGGAVDPRAASSR